LRFFVVKVNEVARKYKISFQFSLLEIQVDLEGVARPSVVELSILSS